jgi:hypothetical protein
MDIYVSDIIRGDKLEKCSPTLFGVSQKTHAEEDLGLNAPKEQKNRTFSCMSTKFSVPKSLLTWCRESYQNLKPSQSPGMHKKV